MSILFRSNITPILLLFHSYITPIFSSPSRTYTSVLSTAAPKLSASLGESVLDFLKHGPPVELLREAAVKREQAANMRVLAFHIATESVTRRMTAPDGADSGSGGSSGGVWDGDLESPRDHAISSIFLVVRKALESHKQAASGHHYMAELAGSSAQTQQALYALFKQFMELAVRHGTHALEELQCKRTQELYTTLTSSSAVAVAATGKEGGAAGGGEGEEEEVLNEHFEIFEGSDLIEWLEHFRLGCQPLI